MFDVLLFENALFCFNHAWLNFEQFVHHFEHKGIKLKQVFPLNNISPFPAARKAKNNKN